MIITSNFRLYSVPARFKMEARDGKSGNWDEFCDWFERGSFPAVFFLFRANEELRDVGRFSPRYRVAQKREREKKKRKILQSAMYFYFGFFWPKIPGDLDLNHSLWCVIFKLFPHISHVKFCAGNAYKCMIYCFSLNLFRALDFLSFFVYKREQRTGTKHRRHTPHWMFQMS